LKNSAPGIGGGVFGVFALMMASLSSRDASEGLAKRKSDTTPAVPPAAVSRVRRCKTSWQVHRHRISTVRREKPQAGEYTYSAAFV
jgi:hypothetical protein